jgi:hypothetical protein
MRIPAILRRKRMYGGDTLDLNRLSGAKIEGMQKMP